VSYLEPVSVSSSLLFGGDGGGGSGGLFANHSSSQLQYTPILSNPRSGTLYYVGIQEVSVAGSVLDIPSSAWSFDLLGDGGTTIDSGTTLTYFVPAAYSVILTAFKQVLLQEFPEVTLETTTAQTFDLCVNVSAAATDSSSVQPYPEFRIRFQNEADFSPPPENYLVDIAPDVKCLALQGLQSDSFGFNTIFWWFMIAKARVSGLLARTVQQPRTRASERARGALPSLALALSLSLPRLASRFSFFLSWTRNVRRKGNIHTLFNTYSSPYGEFQYLP
jgi:hypothetical protein